MGYHPLFEFARMLRVRSPQDVLRNGCGFVGFTVAALRRYKRQVPEDMVRFLRAEQLERLKQSIFRFRDPASGRR